MASIAKRPNGKWRARYRDEAGREHSRHFMRKVDAQDWLDEVTASVVTGRYVDPQRGKITFGQWWAAWTERQVWEQTTTDSARYTFASITFAGVPMRLLRASHVEQWVKSMQANGLASSTIRARMIPVRASLRAAVRDRVIAENPTERVVLPRVRRSEHAMQIPTSELVGQGLAAAAQWFTPFIAVCAFAGLRLSEAAGLQLGDVDFLRRTINVQRQLHGHNTASLQAKPPKYGSERVVYAPAALTDLLAVHVATLGTLDDDDGAQWLLWRPSRERVSGEAAQYQWRRVRASVAGLEPFTLHDLRHFYASGLIAAGCDVVTVQRALGHKSATITLSTYAHLWPTAEDKTRSAAADIMAAALAAPADSGRTATGS